MEIAYNKTPIKHKLIQQTEQTPEIKPVAYFSRSPFMSSSWVTSTSLKCMILQVNVRIIREQTTQRHRSHLHSNFWLILYEKSASLMISVSICVSCFKHTPLCVEKSKCGNTLYMVLVENKDGDPNCRSLFTRLNRRLFHGFLKLILLRNRYIHSFLNNYL